MSADKSNAKIVLGEHYMGAEFLISIARGRKSGTLTWDAGSEVQLFFKNGRPEVAVFNRATRIRDKAPVVEFVRGFAILGGGECSFSEGDPAIGDGSLGIDTLGECLVAVLRILKEPTLEKLLDARGGYELHAENSFPQLSAVISKMSGSTVRAPLPGTTLGAVSAGANIMTLRTWLALLVLGALRASNRPDPQQAVDPKSQALRKPMAPSGGRRVTKKVPLSTSLLTTGIDTAEESPAYTIPTDPEARTLHDEIVSTHHKLDTISHYELLGIPSDIKADDLKTAYFTAAKKWHSDGFSRLGLDIEVVRMGEDIFNALEAAHQVLSDAKQRTTYDWVIEREAKGWPTDPKIIMQAEGIFSKAESMVSQGNAGAAEPLLAQALELNPSEADFWIFHGFALYSLRGSEVLVQAQEEITKGMGLSESSDRAQEFLGRIERIEGNQAEARTYFKKALEYNPKNVGAQRELRLMEMRKTSGTQTTSKSGLGGLLGKVLKR